MKETLQIPECGKLCSVLSGASLHELICGLRRNVVIFPFSVFLSLDVFNGIKQDQWCAVEIVSFVYLIYVDDVFTPQGASVRISICPHNLRRLLVLDRDPFAFTCSIQMKQHVPVWAGGRVGWGRAGGWYMLITQWGKLNEELNMDIVCNCESMLVGGDFSQKTSSEYLFPIFQFICSTVKYEKVDVMGISKSLFNDEFHLNFENCQHASPW